MLAIEAVAVVFAVGMLGSVVLARYLWLADVINLFRPHLFVAGVCLFLLYLMVRRRLAYWLGFAVILAGLLPLMLTPPAAQPMSGDALTLMTANLYVENTDFSALELFIREVRPDIVLTQETTPLWQATATFAAYPNRSSPDLSSRGDMQLLSRYPIVSERIISGEQGYAAGLVRHPVRFEIAFPGQTVVLYAVHPDTLKSQEAWRQRNLYLDLVAEQLALEPTGGAVIVAGDWNTPTWSPFYKIVLARGGLRSTDDPWCPKPTRFSLRFGGFPLSTIDHVAVSKNIGLDSLEVGPKFGSNHLPVVARLTIPRSRNAD